MARLRQLIEAMREVQVALGAAAMAARDDPAQKPVVINLRRQLANALRLVSAEMDVDAQMQEDPAFAEELRRRFSEMRTRIAIFQAKWPAVLLDNRDPDFLRVGDELRASNLAFVEWAMSMLRR